MEQDEFRARLEAWEDDVVSRMDEEVLEQADDWMNDAGIMQLLNELHSANVGELALMLSACLSELIGRFGTETVNQIVTSIVDDPHVRELGDLVHARRIINLGGTPDQFARDESEE
jgi:hypothetical protein